MRRLWLAFLLLAGLACAEEMRIEIIELQHRFADQVLPMVRPLLPYGASATAHDNKLILKTTAANLSEIRTIVEALDRAPEQLLVTVRYGESRDTEDSRTRIDAQFGTEGNSLNVQNRSYSTQSRDRGNQQVRVLSGQSAWINVSQDVPTLELSGGYPATAGIAYQSVGTGFSVTPRLVGERVTVDINPSRSRLSNRGDGSMDTSGLSTSVSGRLGEWIPLGGALEESSSQSRTYSTHSRDLRDQSIFLKIEKLD